MKRKQVVSLMLMLAVAFSMCVPTMAAPKAPAKVTSLSVSKSGSTATVKWKKLKKKPSGYAVYQKKGSSSWQLVKRASKNASSVKLSIKTSEQNQFKVRAYKTYKVKKYYNKKTKQYVSKKAYKKLSKKNRSIKKVTAYKYGKYSPTKTIAAVKTNTNTNTSTTKYEIKYDYTLTPCVVDAYVDRQLIIGVKSNNPSNMDNQGMNVDVYLIDKNTGKEYHSSLDTIGEDNKYIGSEWNIVNATFGLGTNCASIIGCKGGFLKCMSSGGCGITAGTYRVVVREFANASYNCTEYADKEIGTIEVQSYDKLYNEFMNGVLSEITTNDMTKEQKMDAVQQWIFDNFSYVRETVLLDGTTCNSELTLNCEVLPYTVRSVTCVGVATWIKNFANVIGYPVESRYGKDGSTESSGQVEHVYMVHVDDSGKVDKSFNFSPPTRKNLIATEDDYIDLSRY